MSHATEHLVRRLRDAPLFIFLQVPFLQYSQCVGRQICGLLLAARHPGRPDLDPAGFGVLGDLAVPDIGQGFLHNPADFNRFEPALPRSLPSRNKALHPWEWQTRLLLLQTPNDLLSELLCQLPVRNAHSLSSSKDSPSYPVIHNALRLVIGGFILRHHSLPVPTMRPSAHPSPGSETVHQASTAVGQQTLYHGPGSEHRPPL